MKHSTLQVSDFQYLKAFRQLLPARLLARAVDSTSRVHRRERKLPARLLLGCLIAWFFFAQARLPFIAGWLCRRRSALPGDRSIYQARSALGWAPLRWLCRRVLRPLAEPLSDGYAFHRGMRLLAIDGTTFTVADSPANARCFGRAGNQHKPSGYPLIRLVGLCEVGTHALLRWLSRGYRRSEQALAGRLYRHVPAGSLLLADRNFHCFDLWRAACEGGWSLLTRVQSGPRFAVEKALPDGSWLSRVYPRRGQHKRARAIPVRVIRYEWTDESGQRHCSRLLTSLLDWLAHPASGLLEVYHRRWEQEGVFGEIKSALAQRVTQVRAEDPLRALQELDGLLLGHFVLRWAMLHSARRAGVAAVEVSFAGALRLLRTRLGGAPASVKAFQRWWQDLTEQMGRDRVRKRRPRRCPRKRKLTRCPWPAKKAQDREVPVPAFAIVPPP